MCVSLFVFNELLLLLFNNLKYSTYLIPKKIKTGSGEAFQTYLLDQLLDLFLWASLFAPNGHRPTHSWICGLEVVISNTWGKPHDTNPRLSLSNGSCLNFFDSWRITLYFQCLKGFICKKTCNIKFSLSTHNSWLFPLKVHLNLLHLNLFACFSYNKYTKQIHHWNAIRESM